MTYRTKNEYGARLSNNGYAPSIIPGHDEFRCKLCGRNGTADPLNRHEVFGGAYREKSKRLGLWVNLCHWSCHQGPNGVHSNAAKANELKAEAQRMCMQQYGWTVREFITEFGKNYIEEEE